MQEKKKLGIWMSQSLVHLMEYTNEEPIDMDKIPCLNSNHLNTTVPVIEFSSAQKEEIFRKQQEYKKLAEKISAYDEIVLFGPVDAKQEFKTYLETNMLDKMPNIEIKQTEIMTEAQQTAYVHHHFYHHNNTNV
jgi:hypothetical protein